jgi:hypothetical protein
MVATRDLLLTANLIFPLVTIHRETIDPSICQIGRVVWADKIWVSLHEIDPHAKWEQQQQYRLSEITRVDFGGAYEEALYLVSRTYLRR